MYKRQSPGRALELISEGKDTAKKSEKRKCADLLVRALVSQKSAGILDAAAEFPKGRENALEALRLCEFALRDILVKKCTSDAQMMFFSDGNDAEPVSYTHLDVYKRQVPNTSCRTWTGGSPW